jgi:hypothetical protein
MGLISAKIARLQGCHFFLFIVRRSLSPRAGVTETKTQAGDKQNDNEKEKERV